MSTAVYSMTFPDLRHAPPDQKSMQEGLLFYFQNLDPRILQIEDEGKLQDYLVPLNYKINRYVQDRFKINMTEYYEIDDPAILVAGLLLGHYELSTGLLPIETKIDWREVVECVGSALGIVKGVKDIITSYTAIMNGSASIETVWGVVRTIGKKYFGFITAGIALYKFGDCMDWW